MDWTNKNDVIEKVKRSSIALKKAVMFQDDEEVVLTAVRACGLAIEYASDRIKKNRYIVSIALSNFGSAIVKLPEYHDDIEMICIAYDNDPDIIKYFKNNIIIKRQLQLYEYQKGFQR